MPRFSIGCSRFRREDIGTRRSLEEDSGASSLGAGFRSKVLRGLRGLLLETRIAYLRLSLTFRESGSSSIYLGVGLGRFL